LQHVGKVFIVPQRSAAQSKALLLLETKPDVFIGDSESDYEAARVAGVRFVAVATGQRSRKYLLSKGVAEVSASFGDAFLAAQQTLRV
jgi:phosphoglycolate phosphatase-like HAD superfamily hydrolase